MELIDIIIILVLISFSIIGFNRGVFQSVISFLGFIVVIFAAYAFKNILGDILVLNLPFVNFSGTLSGLTSLNVIMYQAISFIIILAIFGIIYKLLITISGVFEKLLRFTVILGIPSKLLGLLFGLLEGYVIIYLALFFLNQPFLKIIGVENSKYVPMILNDTPIISSYAEKSLNAFNEIKNVINMEDNEEKNLKLAEIILKDKVISKKTMQKLVDDNKLRIGGLQEVLDN